MTRRLLLLLFATFFTQRPVVLERRLIGLDKTTVPYRPLGYTHHVNGVQVSRETLAGFRRWVWHL